MTGMTRVGGVDLGKGEGAFMQHACFKVCEWL